MRRIALVVVTASLAGCFANAPDPVIAVRVANPVITPFHGPHGPATEPVSLTFQWTVLVEASGEGARTRVRSIHTRIRERMSGDELVRDSRPFSDLLLPGNEIRVDEIHGGFFPSSLYPGDWVGESAVEIVHLSGTHETVTTSFEF